MTDEFKVGIDADLFRSTNDAWNKLMLNDPWSVGYVTSLIESKQWKSKEEWECWGSGVIPWQSYPKMIDKRYMKNGRSDTPCS